MHVESVVRLGASLADPELWHPHHLVYEPLGVVLVRLVRAVVPATPALAVLQALSVAAGALVLFAFGRMMAWAVGAPPGQGGVAPEPAGARRASLAVFLLPSCLCPLLLGATFGFWYYAGEAEVYVPALACVASSLLVVAGPASCGRGRIAIGAALLALGTLLHQMIVLLAPVLLLWFARWRRETRAGVALVAAWGGLALLGYAMAWHLAARRAPEGADGFWSWVTYYAHAPMRAAQGWGHPRVTSPLAALVGLARAMLGGHVAVALDSRATALLRRLLPGAFLQQEFGIVQGMPRAVAWTVAAAGGAAVFFWVRAASRPAPGPASGAGSALQPLFGLWALVISGFTLWWEPDNLEFWLLALPGLLGIVLLREARRWSGRVVGIWVLLQAGATFGGSIAPKVWGRGAGELALFARAARLPATADAGRVWARFGEPYLPGQVLSPLWKMSWSPQEELAADIAAGRARVWILPDSVAAQGAPLPGSRVDAAAGWQVRELGGPESTEAPGSGPRR